MSLATMKLVKGRGMPHSLQVLIDRFDPGVFDAPQGRARIRLIIPAEGQWDVLWTRLPRLEPPALFVLGKLDRLVPIAFAAHVRRALPAARHLELDCGHVPQLECPAETHAAIAEFLRDGAPG
jgi:pimeloyl-ACP methyl ester carboxylesterase